MFRRDKIKPVTEVRIAGLSRDAIQWLQDAGWIRNTERNVFVRPVQ